MSFVFQTRVQTRLADTDTPVSIYLRIRDHFPESLLLESADREDLDHKYSYICCLPAATISITGEQYSTTLPGGGISSGTCAGPEVLQMLSDFAAQLRIDTTDELYETAGLFGYFSYDAFRYFDTFILEKERREAQIPDMLFSFYSCVLVFDHFKNMCYIIEYIPDGAEPVAIAQVEKILDRKYIPTYPFQLNTNETADTSEAEYLEMVEIGKEHCRKGDVFQIVLSRGFSAGYSGDDFNVYRALRSINPSPYMFYFDYGAFRLLGASPEAQLKIRNDKAVLNPIAGTYRRTGDKDTDSLLVQKLKEDHKENAEHVMLVDLARNDLSKSYQDVSVSIYKDIRFFSHVIHMVSEVTGKAPVDDHRPFRVIADTFPAGTLSGAPKHRAIQLIDAYEKSPRGFYGGSIGFLGLNGDLNLAIIIRSLLSKEHTLYYRAGAGIVASSSAESELLEVHNKLNAVRTSLTLAQTIAL